MAYKEVRKTIAQHKDTIEVLEIARAAILDAIYCDDGLDSGTGKATMNWITDILKDGEKYHPIIEGESDQTKALKDKAINREEIIQKYIDGKLVEKKVKVVCLCGSTRFSESYHKAQLEETLDGSIVLTIGCNMRTDKVIFEHLPEGKLTAIKEKLDELHLRKIDLADEVIILNVDGYIGKSTQRELEYAKANNKQIRYLEPIAEEKAQTWEEKYLDTFETEKIIIEDHLSPEYLAEEKQE